MSARDVWDGALTFAEGAVVLLLQLAAILLGLGAACAAGVWILRHLWTWLLPASWGDADSRGSLLVLFAMGGLIVVVLLIAAYNTGKDRRAERRARRAAARANPAGGTEP